MNYIKSFSKDPVNWIMFIPPNPPTYNENSLPNLFWIPENKYSGPIPCVLYSPSSSNNSPTEYIIIYCHGNAMDLGECSYILKDLSEHLQTTCIAFDYSGYGIATHKKETPSEYTASRDIENVYEYVKNELKYPPERILLYGQSIGSGVAAHCAYYAQQKNDKIMGLFLQSGYTSIRDVAVSFVGFMGNFILNRFNTQNLLKTLNCPILFTHGDKDDVIPYFMSEKMSTQYKGNEISMFHTAIGKGHNNMCTHKDLAIPFLNMITSIENYRKENNININPPPSEFFAFAKK